MTKQDDMGTGVMVGGAMMLPTKDIVDNAMEANNVKTVVAAVKAADLVDTLKSAGPFTVLAPNDAAFAALPAGTLDDLLKPENLALLKGILTYHVISGAHKAADIQAMAERGEKITTVQGGTLTPMLKDGKLWIQDAKGNVAEVETADVVSSNGVTHVITTVLMPS